MTLEAPRSGLRRDLDLLEVLSGDEALRSGGLGVVRVAELLGRQKSQVSRALQALEQEGVVERDRLTRGYRLGWRVYVLAARTGEARMVRVAAPYLRRLVGVLQETAHLCVLRGDHVLTLHSEVSSASFRGGGWEGSAFPLPRTTAGPALVSDWTAEAVRAWFAAEGERVEALVADAQAARRQGWAAVSEELERGTVGVCAPVRDVRGRTLAAVSVVATPERFAGRLEEAGRLAARTAAEIGQALESPDGDPPSGLFPQQLEEEPIG